MEELELELRGRRMAVETAMLTLMIHVAATSGNPSLLVAQIVDDIELNLHRAANEAQEHDELKTVDYALASFSHFTAALLAHINAIEPPAETLRPRTSSDLNFTRSCFLT